MGSLAGGAGWGAAPYCKREIVIDDDLMLWGLKLIYEKNKGDTPAAKPGRA